MIRSSFVASLGIGLIVLGNVACGDKPPPKPPETPTPSATDGGESSTSTESHDGGAGGGTTTTETTTPPPAAAKLELPAASAKAKGKAKAAFDVEVKSDGTVNSGGKPVAKISGMELQDPGGKTQLKVDSDGTITTGDGAAYAKFEGDDLTSLVGAKYAVGDDGALSSTDDKGKKSPMGKSEGVGGAKRSVLLSVAFVMWGTKAPAPPAGKKPADKPGDKKPGDKPGDKKPGGKK